MHHSTLDEEIEALKALLPFTQITKLIEPGRNRRPLHVATLGRWRDPGVRARDGSWIKLRAVRFPGGWRTSVQWVREFIDAITADRASQSASPAPIRTAPQRPVQLRSVDAALDGQAEAASPVRSKRRERELARVDADLDALSI